MKKVLKIFACALACLLLITSTAFADGNPAPQSSEYIFGTYANITAGNNGSLTITFRVTSTGPMTELGASAIDIYENSGRSFKLIDTIYPTNPDYSNMMGNGTYHGSNITYTGTIGYKYYADVHLTAKNSTGSDTIIESTPTVTAKR